MLTDVNKSDKSKSTSIQISIPHPKADKIKHHAVIKLKDVVLSYIFVYGTKLEGYGPCDNHENANMFVGTLGNMYKLHLCNKLFDEI